MTNSIVPEKAEIPAPTYEDIFTVSRLLGFIFNVPAHTTRKQAQRLLEEKKSHLLTAIHIGIQRENNLDILENLQKIISCDGPTALIICTDILERKPQFDSVS